MNDIAEKYFEIAKEYFTKAYENSNISSEIKTYILETGGKKVPEGFEVSHKVPLYTKNIKDRKLLDISDNMELIPKELHRQMHMFCGNTYHLYNPSLFKY